MRMRWLLLLAAAAIAASAALVDASVSGARSTVPTPTTNVYAWIGLKNSDDVGTKFEVKAEVTNGTSEGYSAPVSVPAGSSGFNNAKLVTIPVTNYSGSAGQPISVTISVRVACNSGHASGTARLWWNDAQANSRVEDSGFGTRWLTGTNRLSSSVGSGPKMTKDVFVKKNGCPDQPDSNWQEFGTWTQQPLSSGCALLNGSFFDFKANSAGFGAPAPFLAGEHITVSAGEPHDGGSPTAVSLSVNSVVVDTDGFPGTLEYTIPADGSYRPYWAANGGSVTWAVSCTN